MSHVRVQLGHARSADDDGVPKFSCQLAMVYGPSESRGMAIGIVLGRESDGSIGSGLDTWLEVFGRIELSETVLRVDAS